MFDFHLNSLFLISTQLSLSLISTLQSRSASPSSSKSQASKMKTTIARRRSRAPRTESDQQVWAMSELGTPINLFDPTIRLEMETMTENWSDMESEWVRVVVIVIVVVVIVVVEDRWISGRILLLWKIGESLLLSLLLWLLLWKIGELVAGFCWRVAG